MAESKTKIGSVDSIADYAMGHGKEGGRTPPAPPPPPPTPTTIGNITINGSGTVTESDVVEYTATNDGDAGGLTYGWTVVGGTAATTNQKKCSVTWGSSGSGRVACTITSSDENAADSPKNKEKSITIEALPPPPTSIGNLSITGDFAPTENTNTTYSITADGDNIAKSYAWSAEGGSPAGATTGNTFEVVWGSAGSGKVSCTVASSDPGVTDSPKTKEENVAIAVVFSLPAIGAVSIVGDQNPTEGDTATYEAMNDGDATGLQYDWNVSNGSVQGPKNKKTIDVTVGSSGNMTLQCRVSSDDDSVIDSPVFKEANIPVAFPPASFGNVSLEGLQQMSIGEQQTVTAKYDGDVKSPIYRWKLLGPSGEIVSGGGLDDDSVVVKATSAGSFDVSCTFDASDIYVADRNKEAKLGISIMPNDPPPPEDPTEEE